MPSVSEKKIWDALVLGIMHHSPLDIDIKQIKMNTSVSALFSGNTELFYECLLDTLHHLRMHENIHYFDIDVPKEYLFNSFKTCRSVFFYFFIKINGIEKDMIEMYKKIGSFKEK